MTTKRTKKRTKKYTRALVPKTDNTKSRDHYAFRLLGSASDTVWRAGSKKFLFVFGFCINNYYKLVSEVISQK